jgi:ABC-type multidrug transport system fused ATPase/permease subunit
LLRKVSYLRGFSRAYMGALPGVVAVVSFLVYTLAVPDADIRPSTLFASLVAFNQLRFPLLFYPMALAQYAQAKVSAIRLEAFLGLREIGSSMKEKESKDNYSRESPDCPIGGISIEDATIYWGDPSVPIIPSGSAHPDSLDGSTHSNKSGRSSSLKKSDKQFVDEEETTPVLSYPHAILRDLSLNVAPGELCAVVGRVGS